MNILFLSDNFPPEVNAASSRVYERACYWVKDGHDVRIITCAPNFPFGKVYPGYKNKWVQEEIKDGINVVRVKTYMASNTGFLLRVVDFVSFMFMAVIVGLFQPKPDVVASTSPQFFTAVGAWMLAKLKRVPFIFEIGDLWPESIKGLGLMGDSFIYKTLEKIELFLYRQAAVI
ncbi:MAG: glycosyltransferase WbuB, partial [Pseudomonadota bacterium]|nr:glycosyltransferase WbuB [Pseudomonadota bacterium]